MNLAERHPVWTPPPPTPWLPFVGHDTPLFLVDLPALKLRTDLLLQTFPQAHLALKSNDLPSLLRYLASWGLGADCASDGELRLARNCGFGSFICTAPWKEDAFLERIVSSPVPLVVVDHTEELIRLDGFARNRLPAPVPVLLRLRPTRSVWSKFGLPPARIPAAADLLRRLPALNWQGFHLHRSWTTEIDRYDQDLSLMGSLLGQCPHPDPILDLGGGFLPENWWFWGNGIRGSRPARLESTLTLVDHAEAIERAWSRHLGTLDRSRALIVEPGRWATARHTHLLSRVVRSESNRLFLDAGTHLTGGPTRRALQVWNLDAPGDTLWDRVLFGPLCDPEDIWTRGVWSLRAPRPGDRLLLADLGAYTFTTRQPWQRPGAPWLGWDGKAVSCLWERDRFSERYRTASEAP